MLDNVLFSWWHSYTLLYITQTFLHPVQTDG
jgi:hypothetical protein